MQEAAGRCNADAAPNADDAALASHLDTAPPLRRRRTALPTPEIEGASAGAPLAASLPRSCTDYFKRYILRQQRAKQFERVMLQYGVECEVPYGTSS